MAAKTWMGLGLAMAMTLAGCDDNRPMDDAGPLPPGVDGGPGVDAGPLPPGTDGGPPGDAGPPIGPTSPLVDPDCVDGMFSEALPTPNVDISDLAASYSPASAAQFVLDTLERRYTTGHHIVSTQTAMRECIDVYLNEMRLSTPEEIYPQIGTVVHECGHGYDFSLRSGFSDATYYINDSPLQLSCSGGDSVARGGMTFPRSELLTDSYQSMHPACTSFGERNCDSYALIYLDMLGADQGFSVLLEEVVQYVNSLATGYAYTNELGVGGGSRSNRDGILNFLWFLERYLRIARMEHPSAYEHIVNGDGGCWRNAILTVWGRAWLYLETTEGMAHQGIEDDFLEGLVTAPELLEEIQRLRDAEGCPAP